MQWRITFLVVIIFFFGGGLLSRLFSLQVVNYQYYRALAEGQHQFYQTLFPDRGEILLEDGSKRSSEDRYYPLAINKEFYQVYLVPKDIDTGEREEVARELSGILEIDEETILERIKKDNDPYEPLKHKIEKDKAEEIEALEIEGVGVIEETWRYYPNNELASHVIGFVGMSEDGKIGQYGLEGYYEDTLNGMLGSFEGEKDTTGYSIPFLIKKFEQARDGDKLVLTIDPNIQFKVEKEIRCAAESWQVESATAIVMDPRTGAILAMANWPTFNPNEYNMVEDVNIFSNSAIQEAYEPGSVFKPITMAIGIDNNKVGSNTTYNDRGQISLRGGVIGNVDGKAYGQQTMTQVLEKSLNTGIVFVQQQIGGELFTKYLEKFNFNRSTDIDLAGEVGGNILNVYSKREIDLATIAFGQGVTVTPLQLISAVGTIANEGKMMQPYIVKEKIDADGNIEKNEPKLVAEIFSKETAEQVTKMMVSVVDNGFGKGAAVKGYSIAGKTGTAQIPDLEKGGYSEDDTIHSFIGFGPAFDPRFIILLKLEKPTGIRFASASLAPVFQKISEYILHYLEIPPQ